MCSLTAQCVFLLVCVCVCNGGRPIAVTHGCHHLHHRTLRVGLWVCPVGLPVSQSRRALRLGGMENVCTPFSQTHCHGVPCVVLLATKGSPAEAITNHHRRSVAGSSAERESVGNKRKCGCYRLQLTTAIAVGCGWTGTCTVAGKQQEGVRERGRGRYRKRLTTGGGAFPLKRTERASTRN